MKIWLEDDEAVLFGDGRLQLLNAVAEQGSLAGAARELGMSYRAAWGRIKASEERLGCSLVERGDKGRRAVRLTDAALEMVRGFDLLRQRADEFLDQAGKPLMETIAALQASQPENEA